MKRKIQPLCNVWRGTTVIGTLLLIVFLFSCTNRKELSTIDRFIEMAQLKYGQVLVEDIRLDSVAKLAQDTVKMYCSIEREEKGVANYEYACRFMLAHLSIDGWESLSQERIVLISYLHTRDSCKLMGVLKYDSDSYERLSALKGCKNTKEAIIALDLFASRAMYPMQADEFTCGDSATYDPGTNTITWFYTLSGRADTKSEFTISSMKQAVYSKAASIISTTPEMRAFYDYSATLKYVYYSKKSGDKLFEMRITAKEYKSK